MSIRSFLELRVSQEREQPTHGLHGPTGLRRVQQPCYVIQQDATRQDHAYFGYGNWRLETIWSYMIYMETVWKLSIWKLKWWLVGGLEHFFMFPCSENNHPNWLSYFSEGLKPPTSYWFIDGNIGRCSPYRSYSWPRWLMWVGKIMQKAGSASHHPR